MSRVDWEEVAFVSISKVVLVNLPLQTHSNSLPPHSFVHSFSLLPLLEIGKSNISECAFSFPTISLSASYGLPSPFLEQASVIIISSVSGFTPQSPGPRAIPGAIPGNGVWSCKLIVKFR